MSSLDAAYAGPPRTSGKESALGSQSSIYNVLREASTSVAHNDFVYATPLFIDNIFTMRHFLLSFIGTREKNSADYLF